MVIILRMDELYIWVLVYDGMQHIIGLHMYANKQVLVIAFVLLGINTLIETNPCHEVMTNGISNVFRKRGNKSPQTMIL